MFLRSIAGCLRCTKGDWEEDAVEDNVEVLGEKSLEEDAVEDDVEALGEKSLEEDMLVS